MRHASTFKNQQGAALVVALLIAALVAVIATRVGNNYLLSYKRGVNTLLGDQASLYLISAETIASQVLLADLASSAPSQAAPTASADVDHYGEQWAKSYPPVPIGVGLATADPILDMQGRFNINNVAPEKRDATPAFTPNQWVFVRLLQTFEEPLVPESDARELTEAVIDWLDEGNKPTRFGGAEDDYYRDLDRPYRAANRLMQDVSELRLVKGMTEAIYTALLPHITALPSKSLAVNVNTASNNVLRALGQVGAQRQQPLSLASATAFREGFPLETGYQDKGEFQKANAWSGAEFEGDLIVLGSEYFRFSSTVQIGELSLAMVSILQRIRQGTEDGKITVISRTIGAL